MKTWILTAYMESFDVVGSLALPKFASFALNVQVTSKCLTFDTSKCHCWKILLNCNFFR